MMNWNDDIRKFNSKIWTSARVLTARTYLLRTKQSTTFCQSCNFLQALVGLFKIRVHSVLIAITQFL